MDHPVRVAWCNILFAANGGEFTPNKIPIIREVQPFIGDYTPGVCNTGFDCGTCNHMKSWLAHMAQHDWEIGWECDKCLKDTRDPDRKKNDRMLPGYYQSGRDPSTDPTEGKLVKFDNQDEDNPPLKGCTRCGWQTSFLQLVLRKPKVFP